MIAVACAVTLQGPGQPSTAAQVADARRTTGAHGRVLDPTPSTATSGELWATFDDARRFSLAVLSLTRSGHWSFGVVVVAEAPTSGHPRDHGPAAGALETASQVTLPVARGRRSGIAVADQGAGGGVGQLDAAASLALAVARRWTPQGWEVVELMLLGYSQTEAATRLGISRQAVGQRLSVALWPEVEAVLTGLAPAHRPAGGSG